jgi:hypothetical protein
VNNLSEVFNRMILDVRGKPVVTMFEGIRSKQLWTPVQFLYIAITVYYLLALFTLLQTITFYHSIRLILCLQQIGEIDNLTVSWDKVLGCVVCRFHVAASKKLHADKYPGAIVRSVAKLAGINLRKCGSFSYWFDNLGFTTEEKLIVVLIITLLLGFSNKFSGVNYTLANNNQGSTCPWFCELRCAWIISILSTSSSKILINDHSTDRVWHRRVLRQGDPLSPLPFVINMDVFASLFLVAKDRALFATLSAFGVNFWLLLFANDVALVLKPMEREG